MTFTEALIEATKAELNRHRQELDASVDVKRIQIVIHVNRGTNMLRSIGFTADRERNLERRLTAGRNHT